MTSIASPSVPISAADAVTSIALAGVGGQGILLASEILARAAVLAGYDVKTNEVHGMAQRGGSVVAQVRFGQAVHSPLVGEGGASVLAAFEKVEALRHAALAAHHALAVVADYVIIPVTVSSGQARYPADVDQRLARTFPRLLRVDVVRIAGELGNPRAANVILTGALSRALPIDETVWREAIDLSVKPAYRELNQRAFAAGRRIQ